MREARLVAVGHVTDPPDIITYASVVSRGAVRIALTVADLNYLQVNTADIQNSYIQAPVAEKIWTVLGTQCGPYSGKSAVVVRSLYVLKRSGAIFRNHLADCMKHMEYMSFPSDPDLCMNPMMIPSDGAEYYSYTLLYVDNIYVFTTMLRVFLQKLTSILS